ncbi:hypothetical protein G6514_002771 [Epicoccum nigrum]|nr:hypothetical protein G6514_002771 [Epicoccum nigrum]
MRPEYSRWRRGLRFACETKGSWGFCDGSRPMPMPKTASNSVSQRASNTPQPTLLDERKTWVRQDREVKLDIFLSLSEEVMEEVLHAGPPLPPSNMNAQQMLAALDRRFTSFKFGDYHHAFCHFLNLHIDSYASLEEFNFEFQTTVEDLRDYGHPLTNVQACSAYFSKLRCTQNPWVEKKLESWDSQASTPKLEDLMKEAIPWTFKPATPHATPKLKTESIPEELVEDSSSQSDTDSSLSTASSHSRMHSRQTSNTTAITTHSLEITIHASSEDIAQITSLPRLPATRYNPAGTPCQLTPKKSMPLMAPLPPMNRPLPPIPKHILHASPRARSASPRITIPSPKTHISSPKASAKSTNAPQQQPPQTPSLRLETVHPTLRPSSPSLLDQKEFGPKPGPPSPTTPTETNLHPALRVTPPLPSASFDHLHHHHHEQNAPVPWPCTPDRPTSARNSDHTAQKVPEQDALTRLRAMSGGSTASLPLLLGGGGRAVSPPRLQDRPLLRSNESSPPLLGGAFAHSHSPPPPPPSSFSPRVVATGDSLHPPSRTPTFDSLGVPRGHDRDKGDRPADVRGIERSRSPVRELVARLSGESGEERERERTCGKGRERKKSWSLGVGLGRFGAGKGVREIV